MRAITQPDSAALDLGWTAPERVGDRCDGFTLVHVVPQLNRDFRETTSSGAYPAGPPNDSGLLPFGKTSVDHLHHSEASEDSIHPGFDRVGIESVSLTCLIDQNPSPPAPWRPVGESLVAAWHEW